MIPTSDPTTTQCKMSTGYIRMYNTHGYYYCIHFNCIASKGNSPTMTPEVFSSSVMITFPNGIKCESANVCCLVYT